MSWQLFPPLHLVDGFRVFLNSVAASSTVKSRGGSGCNMVDTSRIR
jgi:hypothetical protein